MDREQYNALLARFEGSPRYLKAWAYRITAMARGGQRINPQELAVAKKAVIFIEQEGM